MDRGVGPVGALGLIVLANTVSLWGVAEEVANSVMELGRCRETRLCLTEICLWLAVLMILRIFSLGFPQNQDKGSQETVLVLAGIDWIFFMISRMGLCLGSVLDMMCYLLITQGCFSYPWARLFCSSPRQHGGWGAQGVVKEHSQDSWSQLAKGIFQTTWFHA